MDKLTAAIGELTAAFGEQNVASDVATAGVTRLSGAQERATTTSDALASHSLLLARGMDAIGISGGAAATRVAGMVDVLDRMTTAVPGLLVLGAALTTAFAGFEFLKNGVQDASNAQNAMRELSLMTAEAGQSFSGMSDKVQKWAEAMEEASGITQSQTIPAVLRLVDAGQSVGGAMTIATVAAQMVEAGMGRMRGSMDMAESSQMRYTQVLLAFSQAMDGNYTMISRIDPAVRKLVEAHAPLPVIIAAINAQTKDSIEKNNTNAETWERVHGILRATGLEIGQTMLPALAKLGSYMFGLIESCRESGKAFEALGNDIVTVVGGSVDAIGQLASAMSQFAIGMGAVGSVATDAISGQWKNIKGDVQGVQHAFGETGKWGAALEGNLHRIGAAWNDVGSQQDRIQGALNKSLETGAAHLKTQLELLHQQAAASSGVVDSPYKTTAKSGGTGYSAPSSAYREETPEITLQNAAEKDLTETTNSLDTAKQRALVTENNLAIAVKLSTTMQGEAAATQALNTAKTNDAHQQVTMLSAALSEEKSKQSDLAQTMANANQTYRATNDALKQHELGLEGTKKVSLDTKESTAQLSAALADAKSQANDAKSAFDKYTAAIKQHQQELAAAQKAYDEYAAASAEALAALQRKWDEFNQKTVYDQNQTRAIMGMNAAQLVAYYRTQYDQDYQNYVTYLQQKNVALATIWQDRAMAEEQKLNQEQNTLYQQDYNNYKSWLNKSESAVSQFVDDVLTKHKSLRDYLKQIYDDILKAFIEMCVKMIAESTLVQGFLSKAFGFLGGGSGLGGSSGNWAQGTGGIGVGGGGSGASPSSQGAGGPLGSATSSAASSVPSAAMGGRTLAPTGLALAAPAMMGATGGAGAAAGAGGSILPSFSSTFGGNASDSVYGGGYGGASAVPGVGGGATSLLSGIKGQLGNMMMGAMAGSVIANMLDHGNQDAGIGGMVGGAAGTLLGPMLSSLLMTGGMAAGPAGMILGALLGGVAGTLIGGLFGDHFPKSNEPDVYQTQQWGQELADLQGSTSGNPMVANGQKFVMDSNTSSETAGQGWNVMIESFVSKFRSNQKALPTELQAGFPMLEQLWGGAQNTADFNGNGKNGMLQIGSGTMAEWTTFAGYVSAYGPAIAQLMAMYTPTDLYAASLNGSVSQLGGYTPTGDPWLIHSFPDASLPGGGSAAPQIMSTPGGSKQTVVNINNYQQFGGSLIAQHTLDQEIYKTIAKIPGFTQAFDLTGT
jgi:hypothetical protein